MRIPSPFRTPKHRATAKRVGAAGLATALAVGTLIAVGNVQTDAREAEAAVPNGAFACNQRTLYAINGGTSGGDVISIDIVSGATSPITDLGIANNALGISPGGTAAYSFENSGNVNTASSKTFARYTAATDTIQTITNADPGAGNTVIRGGVNPVNGLFYYSNGGTDPRLAAYDPATSTFLGQVGTLSGVTGNGDLAFSTTGTMFIVSGQYIRRADIAIPTTTGTTAIPTTQIADIGSAASNGIAFTEDGYLYASLGSTSVQRVNPSSGDFVGTAISTGTFTPSDLATCNYPNTVTASTTVDEKKNPTDQFGLEITGGGIDRGNTAETTGTQTGTTAGPVLATGGTPYQVEQKPAGGTNLNDYTTTWVCTDDGTPIPGASGTGNTATFTQPTSTTEQSSNVSCAFTNVMKPIAVDDDKTVDAGTTTNFGDLTANDRGATRTITAVSTPTTTGATAILKGDGTVDYTPAPGFSGEDTFTYTISDGNATSTATVTVTVLPEAIDDTASVPSGVTTTIPGTDLTANDLGSDLTVIGATVVSGGGSVTANGGNVQYTPAAGYSGPAEISYTIRDGNGNTSVAIVAITVGPEAADDTVTVPSGTPTTLEDILDNDSGSGLTITGATVTSPAGTGSVAIVGGQVVYTPGDFSGTATVDYTVRDSAGGTSTATVTITVNPIADPDNRTATSGDPVTYIDLRANDHGTGLTITGVTQGNHGGTVVRNSDGTVTYTPSATYSGTETFTYTVTDASGRTSTATVTVAVNPKAVNDARSTVAWTGSTPTSVTLTDLRGNDAGSGLTITAVQTTGSQGGTAALTGGNVRYTPADGFSGTETFTYTVTDAANRTSTATVTMTVSPVAVDDEDATVANQAIAITVRGNDIGTSLAITGVVDPTHGSASVAAGRVNYIPDTDYSGVESFDYTVTDASGQTATATITVTVTPTATDDAFTTPSDTLLVLAQSDLAGDDHGTGLTVTSVGAATTGTGTATLETDGRIHYQPAAGFSGTTTFPYTVTDSAGQSVSAVVTVIVGPTATNDTGTTPAGVTLTVPADGVLGNDGGSGLTATLGTPPSHGTVTLNADGSYEYLPADGFSGTDTFTYTATDDEDQETTALVTITVTPLAVDEAHEIAAGTELRLGAAAGVLSNAKGSGLSVASHGAAAHGTITIAADGAVVYTPNAGFSGVETITYDVVDAEDQHSTGTLTITVGIAAADDAGHTITGRTLTVAADKGLLANDVGTGLTAALATAPANGTVTVNPDGSFTYVPRAGFTGTDTFTYTVTDANGQTTTATATITVAPPPVGTVDRSIGEPNKPVRLSPLDNDTPSGGATYLPETLRLVDPTTGELVTKAIVPGQGTWEVVGSEVVFTPEEGFKGLAEIDYQVTDSNGEITLSTLALTYPSELAFTGAATVSGALVASIVPTGLGLLLLALKRRKRAEGRHAA